MRRILAVAIAAAVLAGPLFASELEMKKKEDEKAAKPKIEMKKRTEPAKGTAAKAPADQCTTPNGATASKVPQTGSAGFFQTVEDIYAFTGPVAELAATPADPKSKDKDKDKDEAKPEEAKKADETKKKAD